MPSVASPSRSRISPRPTPSQTPAIGADNPRKVNNLLSPQHHVRVDSPIHDDLAATGPPFSFRPGENSFSGAPRLPRQSSPPPASSPRIGLEMRFPAESSKRRTSACLTTSRRKFETRRREYRETYPQLPPELRWPHLRVLYDREIVAVCLREHFTAPSLTPWEKLGISSRCAALHSSVPMRLRIIEDLCTCSVGGDCQLCRRVHSG